jgi:formylglycine-generating enzyme required for sulfatase activity
MLKLKNRAGTVPACLLAMAAFAPIAAAEAVPCPADLDDNRLIDTADLSLLLLDFGACVGCTADLDGSGAVDTADISLLLLDFGQCPTWYVVLEQDPDPAVVYDAGLRTSISATGLPWRVRDRGTGIEMVLIPPGSFMMGCSGFDPSSCDSNEYPAHRVTLTSPFYLARTEVTCVQWSASMLSWSCSSNGNYQVMPVGNVSWNDVQVFCDITGFRLPTEAEWEYAYRAGSPYNFHFFYDSYYGRIGIGSDSGLGSVAWHYYNTCNAGSCGPHPVGLKACNFFGLFDMAGNVSEWVNDWYGDYTTDDQTDPRGPATGVYRVTRGGNSGDWWQRAFTASNRSFFTPPDNRSSQIGFRVARNP